MEHTRAAAPETLIKSTPLVGGRLRSAERMTCSALYHIVKQSGEEAKIIITLIVIIILVILVIIVVIMFKKPGCIGNAVSLLSAPK